MSDSFGEPVYKVKSSDHIEVHLKKGVEYKGKKFVGISKFLDAKGGIYVAGVQIPVEEWPGFVAACVKLQSEIQGNVGN